MPSDVVRSVMNVKQLAEHFGVAVSTIHEWRDNEGLPFTKIGSVVRYRLASVDAWHAEYETRKTATPKAVDQPVRRPRKQRAY